MPDKTSDSEHWSAEVKLAVVAETMTFSESELGSYCRKKGLYPDQIKRWRENCLQGFQGSRTEDKKHQQQARADKTAIKLLKRELREKEKALAETAALLVLRKKLKAFYGEDDGDE